MFKILDFILEQKFAQESKISLGLRKKYPKIFNKNATKLIFTWAYEFSQTRSFSNNLPGTFLVPMSDFVNHSKSGVKYHLLNKKFEENDKMAHKNYKILNKTIDLSLLPKFKYQISAE